MQMGTEMRHADRLPPSCVCILCNLQENQRKEQNFGIEAATINCHFEVTAFYLFTIQQN
jgi:hypothetical protein